MSLDSRLCRVVAVVAVVLSTLAVPVARAQQLASRLVVPGNEFPAGSFDNLNPAAGGGERIDLTNVLGKKAVVLHYWIARQQRSEVMFQELQQLVEGLDAERVALYGVAVPRPGMGGDKIRERAETLGIRVPVLRDEGFRLGKMLAVASVPNVSIIDATGTLRLTNGASLSQVLGYNVDLAKAIERAADGGPLMTYGYLQRYFPVRELEGEPAPDFKAPMLADSVERRYHSMIDDSKVNVLIFWSVDCPHCRESLPEINEWLTAHPDGVNIVSCATVTSEQVKTKTREFCELNEFNFPTLVDQDASIGTLYKVTATPTIVIIGPDGVVDSAIVSGYSDFGQTLEEKKRRLLNKAAS